MRRAMSRLPEASSLVHSIKGTSMTITIQSVTVSYDELVEQSKALDNALQAAQNAADAVLVLTDEKNAANLALEAANAALEAERETRLKTQRALADSVAREKALQAQIVEFTKPPVVIPPVSSRFTREFLPRFAGMTVEKGRASPSAALYAQVKTALRWGRSQGLDTWRGFFNPQEVLDHLKETPPLGNLPEYGRAIGFQHWIADTIDRILQLIPVDAKDPSDSKLKAYMDGLEKMGAEGVMINDANRKPSADDPGITFEELKAMIARLRHVAPTMPIFVSLLGSADVSLYMALGVWVEIQTFGSVSELGMFLKKPVIMCLDLRKPLSAAELKTRADLALKTAPKHFFFYADEVYDYDAMPDSEDAVIREFVTAWKRLAG
jgi:hypothetical protein